MVARVGEHSPAPKLCVCMMHILTQRLIFWMMYVPAQSSEHTLTLFDKSKDD